MNIQIENKKKGILDTNRTAKEKLKEFEVLIDRMKENLIGLIDSKHTFMYCSTKLENQFIDISKKFNKNLQLVDELSYKEKTNLIATLYGAKQIIAIKGLQNIENENIFDKRIIQVLYMHMNNNIDRIIDKIIVL